MTVFRPAEAADLPKIIELLKAQDFYNEGVTLGKIMLALEGQEIVGLANERSINGLTELTHVVVLPEYRKKHIASTLVKKILEQTKTDVYLNTIIPEFFIKLGFNPTKDFSTQYAKPEGWCEDCFPERCTAMVKRKTK